MLHVHAHLHTKTHTCALHSVGLTVDFITIPIKIEWKIEWKIVHVHLQLKKTLPVYAKTRLAIDPLQ